MESIKRIVEKMWLAVFILFALYFLITYVGNNGAVLAKLGHANVLLLCAAIVAQLLYFFATVNTWRYLLRISTQSTISFSEGLSQILLVNFGKYIPGKVWGLAARGARLKELGYGLDTISSVSYLEQFILLLAGFWLAFLAASIAFQNIAYIFGLILTTVAIVLFRHGSNLARATAKALPRAAWLEKLFDIRTSALELFRLTLAYMAVWLSLALTFALVCKSVTNIELTVANTTVLLLSLTASFLAGFLAFFAPGGVGVREGVGAALLSTIVPLEDAVLLMLVFRIWVVLAELAAGSVIFVRRMRQNHNNKA